MPQSLPIRRPARFGFTLVELLVVIAIIGILVALLLPAVQAAREAARRTQCLNHVNQDMKAMLMHVDSKGAFPSGGIAPWPNLSHYSTGGGQPLSLGEQGLSWAFQILPYMEEAAVYAAALSNPNLTKDEITAVLDDTVISSYVCPSRRGPTQHPGTGNYLMDYAAAQAQRNPDEYNPDQWDALVPRFCVSDGIWGGYGSHVPSLNDGTNTYWGVIVRSSRFVATNTAVPAPVDAIEDKGHYRQITFAKITDGSSKTVVIGEKFLIPSQYQTGAWHDDKGWADGWDPDVIRSVACPPESDRQTPSVDTNGGGNTFGSAHPGGFNVGFADGSARNLNYDIDTTVFHHHGHRADGVVLDED